MGLKSYRQLQAKQIAEATGLSDSWLSEFAKGELKGASAGRLEALISYLDKPFEI